MRDFLEFQAKLETFSQLDAIIAWTKALEPSSADIITTSASSLKALLQIDENSRESFLLNQLSFLKRPREKTHHQLSTLNLL